MTLYVLAGFFGLFLLWRLTRRYDGGGAQSTDSRQFDIVAPRNRKERIAKLVMEMNLWKFAQARKQWENEGRVFGLGRTVSFNATTPLVKASTKTHAMLYGTAPMGSGAIELVRTHMQNGEATENLV